MPVCAVDQVVKMELTPNGCKRFICGMYSLLACSDFNNYIAVDVHYVNCFQNANLRMNVIQVYQTKMWNFYPV